MKFTVYLRKATSQREFRYGSYATKRQANTAASRLKLYNSIDYVYIVESPVD